MSRLKATIFASAGSMCRCGGQAFFDMCLSTCNRMAAYSYMPPAEYEKAAALKIQTTARSMEIRAQRIDLPSSGFFLFCRWADRLMRDIHEYVCLIDLLLGEEY